MKLLNELRFLSVSTLVFMLISVFAVSYLFFYQDVDHHLGNNAGTENADSLSEELVVFTENQNKGKTLFNQNCGRCHSTTDQKIIGPGLRNVMERIDTVQMVQWVQNSEKLRRDDPYFKELFLKFDNSPMPAFPQLKREDILAIIDYIDVASKGPVAMK